MQRFGQSLHNVAGLVDLTALDRRGSSEGSADCFGQGLRAIDDEEPRHRRVEPALDEIVDECLNGRGIFRCTLGEAERMLVALCIDTECRDQDQIVVHVNAVDLDHQQIEAGEIRRHPLLQACRRQCHETAGGGRFRQPSPCGRWNVSCGQPNRPGKLTCRDVDQHLVHGPLAEPVLGNCRLPARQSLLLALKAAKPWSFDLDIAAVEADLPFVFPQRCARRKGPRHGVDHRSLRIVIHHLAKRFHAELGTTTRARRHVAIASNFSSRVGSAVNVVSLFMALLSFVD